VFSVADVLDALTTLRPYRVASPLQVAREVIVAGSGTQFDPEIIAVFAAIPDERLVQLRREVG
jgi:ribonuclease P protein subunit RPR2